MKLCWVWLIQLAGIGMSFCVGGLLQQSHGGLEGYIAHLRAGAWVDVLTWVLILGLCFSILLTVVATRFLMEKGESDG